MTVSARDSVIRVNREVSVSRAEGSNEVHIESILPLRPRVRRLSDSSSILSDIFRHPDVHEEALRRKIRQTNGQHSPKDLVDFFRNTSPPPHNFMSIPDWYDSHTSEEERSKWKLGPLKTFRKKKKNTKKARRPRPKSITLPDSAVVGTTIGGHRHIAISIPIEHAHLDYNRAKGRSVYKPTGIPADWSPPPAEQFIETRAGPVRSNTDPRVVTVLKPVVEARESLESLMQASMTAEEALAMDKAPVLLDSPTRTLNEILATTPAPLKVETLNTDELRPKTADTLARSGAASPSPRLSVFQHSKQTSLSNPTSPVRVYCPQRRSSMGRGSVDNRGSFEAPSVHRHRRGLSGESNALAANRLSIAESILTNGTEPVIGDATMAQGYEVSANRFSVLTNAETIVYAPVIGTARRRTVCAVESWPPAIKERGIVQDYKGHGRAASDQGPTTSQDKVEDTQTSVSLTRAGSMKKAKPTVRIPTYATSQDGQARADTPGSAVDTLVDAINRYSISESLSLVPFMVVAEVQPSSLPASPLPASPLPASPPPSRGGLLHEAPTSDSLNSYAETVIKAASPPPAVPRSPISPPHPASGGPTPPESPQRTDDESLPPPIPVRKRPASRGTVSLDRVSLHRRREWAAERERDRESRLRAQAEAREAIHAETQTANPRLSHGPRTDSHRDLARRFDALQDARDRDLEARLSRLEESGNTWLSTMVPLFQKLNESLTRLSENDDDFRRSRHELPSWEDLKREEIAQEYRARQERERRRMLKRQTAQSGEAGERPESRRGRSSRHRSSRRDSRGYDLDYESDHRPSMTTTKKRNRQSAAPRSLLQDEFEAELARRRRLEELNEAVDARMTELSNHSRRGSAHTLVVGHRAQQSSRGTSVDLGGLLADGDEDMFRPTNGLDTLEPLMRELMGGSTLPLEGEQSADDGEPSDEVVEYLFEEF